MEGFGITFKHWKNDIPAGLVVFVVAIPLCLGIALASGAPLFSGVITGIIGGIVVGTLSGSSLSVSGPAAGLTVIVLNSINQLGSFEAFLAATVLAGFIQLLGGYVKAGVIRYYFPASVIKGMLAAIGAILILKQFPHLVGLHTEAFGALEFSEADGTNTFTKLGYAVSHINQTALIVGLLSLTMIVIWETKWIKKTPILKNIPSAIVAVIFAVLLTPLLKSINTSFVIHQDQFVNIPKLFSMTGAQNAFAFPDWTILANYNVYIVAFTIAIIASLETLLSVEATDKLDVEKRKSPANQELKAQGIGNIIVGMIGGLPMTAVIVRSTANISSGGKTKLAAITHGVFLLLFALFLPHILNMIPLSALAAVLIAVGYKLIKPALFVEQWNLGKEQFIPFVVTIIAILFTDLLIGIIIGLNVGAYFILLSNYNLPFSLTKQVQLGSQTHSYRMSLSENVSFLNKAKVQHFLEEIEDNSTLIIDGTLTQTMDHDVLEIIYEFQTNAHHKNIELELIDIPELKTHHNTDIIKHEETHTHTKEVIDGAFSHNRKWIADKLHDNPNFFDNLNESQHPDLLWIGCSDSRVVPNLITGLDAGDIFTHRNIANLIKPEDINAQSAIDYAVSTLKVSHVVVCGHYNCGGVKAALSEPSDNVVMDWVQPLRELAKNYNSELDQITDFNDKVNRLVELNVEHQIQELMKIESVRIAIAEKRLQLHGWVFDLRSGELKDTHTLNPISNRNLESSVKTA